MRHLQRLFRLLLGLYVAGCVAVTTLPLLGYLAVSMWGWFDDGRKWSEAPNIALFERQFDRQPKQVDIAMLAEGDWTLACLLGRHAGTSAIRDIATSKNISHDKGSLEKIGLQKTRSMLLYIKRSGDIRWSLPQILNQQIASGEVVCITPDAPIFKLPTEAALKGHPP